MNEGCFCCCVFDVEKSKRKSKVSDYIASKKARRRKPGYTNGGTGKREETEIRKIEVRGERSAKRAFVEGVSFPSLGNPWKVKRGALAIKITSAEFQIITDTVDDLHDGASTVGTLHDGASTVGVSWTAILHDRAWANVGAALHDRASRVGVFWTAILHDGASGVWASLHVGLASHFDVSC